jgi:hypothetical protein
MIRKTAIVILATMALGCLVGWPISHRWPLDVRYLNDGLFPKIMVNPDIDDDAVVLRIARCEPHDLFVEKGKIRVVVGWNCVGMLQTPQKSRHFTFAGMEIYVCRNLRSGYRNWEIHAPLALAAILFAAYPGVALLHPVIKLWRRNRRPHLCQDCGYDLRGTTSAQCSECGAPAAVTSCPPARST